MKWLEFLKPGPRVKPLPPIKTVQSPGLARKERMATDSEDALPDRPVAQANPGIGKPKEIDPIFEDTGSLELTQEPEEQGNPYDTQSWQMDPRDGLRRVDNLKAVNREPVDRKTVTNPYDTGIVRKGW
jgi:hypothetical protein